MIKLNKLIGSSCSQERKPRNEKQEINNNKKPITEKNR